MSQKKKERKSLLPQENPFIGLFTLKYIIEIKANHLKNGFKFKVYIPTYSTQSDNFYSCQIF